MKSMFAILTVLLLGSVTFATPITEPATFKITARSIRGPARTITFTFASDPPVGPPNSDSITITHTGSGTFCLPDGTTFIPESTDNVFTFNCSGFHFAANTSVDFLEANGALSDNVSVFNTVGGSQGTFISDAEIAEPAGLALLGSGLLILGAVLRRRARKGIPPGTR